MVITAPAVTHPLAGDWPAVQRVGPEAYAALRALDPDATTALLLVHEARACEPAMLLTRRTACLDAVAAHDPTATVRHQVEAERAVDDARANRLDAAEARARAVLAALPPEQVERGDALARARALEALGRTQAWRGDEGLAGAARATLLEAAALYRRLGCDEWAGYLLYWTGHTVHLQRGEPAAAEEMITAGLALLPPGSPRRATALTHLADVLELTGRWAELDACLDEAGRLAVQGDDRAHASVAWARAHAAATRRDAAGTARHLAEVERHRGEWFDIAVGTLFLGDAAAMMARVGDDAAAAAYLHRAVARDPEDEFVRMAGAELLARRGDPEQALAAILRLGHAPWLETRNLWRLGLLAAWASLRAGRADAGEVAARAFAQADALAGPAVALSGEPELVAALAPLAARAGSPHAAALLAPTTGLQVRVLGESTLLRGTATVPMPAGVLGALVRVLAVHPAGLEAERLAALLWPDRDPTAGRRQLRHALSRLRTTAVDLVVRDGARLRLDAWVDAVAFERAADRAVEDGGEGLLLGALALWGGAPLPADPYADWAAGSRTALHGRRLRLLDLAATAAEARRAPAAAQVLLERAIEADPDDLARYARVERLACLQDRPEVAARWRVLGDRRLAGQR